MHSVKIEPKYAELSNPRVGLIALATDFRIEKDFISVIKDQNIDFFVNRIHCYFPLTSENLIKMSGTVTEISEDILPKEKLDLSRIIPTENDFEFRGQLLKGNVHDMGAAMLGGVGGHAGLFSNANDLAKIMQLYLNKGNYAGKQFFSNQVIEEFTKCHFCEQENRRGIGFDKPALENQEGGPTCKCVSGESFGHTGFTGTLAWADPDTDIIYIFLSNRIHPDASNKKLLDMDVRTNIMEQIFMYNER